MLPHEILSCNHRKKKHIKHEVSLYEASQGNASNMIGRYHSPYLVYYFLTKLEHNYTSLKTRPPFQNSNRENISWDEIVSELWLLQSYA